MVFSTLLEAFRIRLGCTTMNSGITNVKCAISRTMCDVELFNDEQIVSVSYFFNGYNQVTMLVLTNIVT